MDYREQVRGLSLKDWADLAGIVGVVVGVVSLWFVYAELRHQTHVSMAANSQALVELTLPMNVELAKNPELSVLWANGSKDYGGLSPDEKARYQRIWVIYLNILANAYNQHRQGLIEEQDYTSWQNDLVRNREPLAMVWPELRQFYPANFAKHVEAGLANKH